MTYGLGTENQNLPGFVVLGSGGIPLGGINIFGNGFLPAVHQGSMLYPENAEPLNNVQPRETDRRQRGRLGLIGDLDAGFVDRIGGDRQVEAAIDNYEIAYRMQTAVPELVDLAGETEATAPSTAWTRPSRRPPPTGASAWWPAASSNAVSASSSSPWWAPTAWGRPPTRGTSTPS